MLFNRHHGTMGAALHACSVFSCGQPSKSPLAHRTHELISIPFLFTTKTTLSGMSELNY
uniref:Uncharacterized protein n=1 Tax=Arion vulgaris TaxID=1028688 RepID=A0A0B7ANL6_9EUPU